MCTWNQIQSRLMSQMPVEIKAENDDGGALLLVNAGGRAIPHEVDIEKIQTTIATRKPRLIFKILCTFCLKTIKYHQIISKNLPNERG